MILKEKLLMLELKICNQSHIVPRNPIHLSYKKYME